MEDIITIKGVLNITMPAEIERFTVTDSDIGKQFEAQALSVNLRSMDSKSLVVDVSGMDAKRRFLSVVAITDTDPDSVRQTPRSWSTTENGDKLRFSYDFDNVFNQAELYVANQINEKQNTFTLSQKSATIELN